MPQCELTQPILSSQWTAVRAQINTADSGGVMPPLCGVVLGALKGEHVALTPARTAVPLDQPIVVNEVAGQTEL